MARINFKTIAKNVDYTTFATYQEMLSYAGGSLSYPGQILGVLQAHDTPDNVTPFILDANKTPVGIASFTKVQEMIEDQIGNMAGALVLQGNVPSDEFNDALTNHTAGWTFVVTTAGTYVGQTCNIGDMIVCKTTGTSANNADWFVVESNQPNMVTSDISSPLNQEVPVFGATGKTIGGSGVSMGQVATILENQIQKGAGNLLTTEELNGIKQQLGVGGAASSAAKLTTARTIDGVAFDGSKAISHLGLCNTAANQAAKSATVTGFQLVEGARVNIFFPAGNTAQQPTLNINNTGAKNISFPPSMKSDIPAYGMMEFVYYSNSYMPISSGQLKTSIENAVVNDSGTPTVPNEIAIFRDTAGKDIMGAGFEADTLLALNGNKIGFGGGLELNDNELNGIKQQLGVGGAASEAAKLTTARTIWGQSFDGTGNVSGDMTGVGSISMTGSITNPIGIVTAKGDKNRRIKIDSSGLDFIPASGGWAMSLNVRKQDLQERLACVIGAFGEDEEDVQYIFLGGTDYNTRLVTLMTDTGNLGIGTTTNPTEKLDVNGDALIREGLTVNGGITGTLDMTLSAVEQTPTGTSTTMNYTATGRKNTDGLYLVSFDSTAHYSSAIVNTTITVNGTTYALWLNRGYNPITLANCRFLTSKAYMPVYFKGSYAYVLSDCIRDEDNSRIIFDNGDYVEYVTEG